VASVIDVRAKQTKANMASATMVCSQLCIVTCLTSDGKANFFRDVALMLHAHLLSPFHFAEDMSRPPYHTLAGVLDLSLFRLQDKLRHINERGQDADALEWNAKYPGTPHSHVMNSTFRVDNSLSPRMKITATYLGRAFVQNFQRALSFSIDLVQVVKCQIVFARKITSIYPYDPVPESLLHDSRQRYAKYMNLIRINAVETPVPALDIDLFWHTHQLASSNYMPWCQHHIGRYINHDDTVGTGDIASGLDGTKGARQRTYNDDYLNPSAGISFQSAPREREPSTADKTPPPNLTPAQRALWDFDVRQQLDHEDMDFRLRKLHEILA
jgi:hypothetical protein